MSLRSARPVGTVRRAALGAGAVVAALALVAGCTGSPGPTEPGPTAERPTGDVSPSEEPTPEKPTPTPTPTPTRAASNVPLTKLAPGENPPQFIIFSFDGAGWHDRWTEFREDRKSVV